jgi:hypothetical protein
MGSLAEVAHSPPDLAAHRLCGKVRSLKSKAGWTLATIYLVVSLLALYRALHCSDDFFCGIAAIPMLIPAGVVYLLLFSDYLTSPAILQWPLIVPTLVTNAGLYYLLGRWIGRIARRRR